MEDLVRRRDEDLESLELKQEEEMGAAVKGLGSTHQDDQINAMATRHFEQVQMAESKWASEISAFRESQRREYRCVTGVGSTIHLIDIGVNRYR